MAELIVKTVPLELTFGSLPFGLKPILSPS